MRKRATTEDMASAESLVNVHRTESTLSEKTVSSDAVVPQKPTLKYGELVILGYNGCGHGCSRRKSKFVLYQRLTANGVKPSGLRVIETSHPSKISSGRHSVSYSTSPNTYSVVMYELDEDSDMFQIGRSVDPCIDMTVFGTSSGEKKDYSEVIGSSISRFACRILANRTNSNIVRIYAAGFDSSQNIFLGERTPKSQMDGEIDALTTNGVLIWHPKGSYCGGDAVPGTWREVSVCGNILSLRRSRSSEHMGEVLQDETNVLSDGTLIDLCGVTLLWRSAEALENAPTKLTLETLVDELNAGRPQCPVGLSTLVISRKRKASSDLLSERHQPYVYLTCGHVQGRHTWGQKLDSKFRICPICLQMSLTVKLCMGVEPAFYVDIGPLTHAFNPCGHMATEKTVKFWAQVPIPRGSNSFECLCPFCATQLSGSPGYVRLIFQDHLG